MDEGVRAAIQGIVRFLQEQGGRLGLPPPDHDCGVPRSPVLPLDPASYQRLVSEMDAIPSLRGEPRGW